MNLGSNHERLLKIWSDPYQCLLTACLADIMKVYNVTLGIPQGDENLINVDLYEKIVSLLKSLEDLKRKPKVIMKKNGNKFVKKITLLFGIFLERERERV